LQRSRTPSVVPLHLPSVATLEGNEISIVDSTPQSKLPNRFAKSSLHPIAVMAMRVGSFEARACSKRSIPRGLHPALLESLASTITIRATDFCYRTVTDEYPRCVRLPAASTSLRPWCIDQSSDWPSRMNRAFHDARLASTFSFAPRERCLQHER